MPFILPLALILSFVLKTLLQEYSQYNTESSWLWVKSKFKPSFFAQLAILFWINVFFYLGFMYIDLENEITGLDILLCSF